MPKQNDLKYGKKSSFSREKSFAYSETDIERNEKKLEEYKSARSVERKHNIDVANGLEEKDKENKGGVQGDSTGGATLLGAFGALETWFPLKKEKKVKKEREDRIGYKVNDVCVSDTESLFYYKKMNLIVCNLPAFYNLDSLVLEFATYGKIQYITYMSHMSHMSMCEDGTNCAKLVIDGWHDCEDVDVSFIIDVQTAILREGKYMWTSNDVGKGKLYIVRDPDQKDEELGDQIVCE